MFDNHLKHYLLGGKSFQFYFEHLASGSLRQFDGGSKGRFSMIEPWWDCLKPFLNYLALEYFSFERN
jgi:hypothetical protein